MLLETFMNTIRFCYWYFTFHLVTSNVEDVCEQVYVVVKQSSFPIAHICV